MIAAEVRQSCEHVWERVGFQERTPVLVAVVYVCEKCSSYTYREMSFVGYRLGSIEELFDDELESGGGESGGSAGEPGGSS